MALLAHGDSLNKNQQDHKKQKLLGSSIVANGMLMACP